MQGNMRRPTLDLLKGATSIPNNGDALLNYTRENSKGATTSISKAYGIGELEVKKVFESLNPLSISYGADKLEENIKNIMKPPRTSHLPAVKVDAFKDKNGKIDNHKTDPDDVRKKEIEMLRDIKIYKSNKNRGR